MDKSRRKCIKFIGQATLFTSLLPPLMTSCEESTMQTDWHGTLNGSEKRLKKALTKVLRESKYIHMMWECGGDQAILYWKENESISKYLGPSLQGDLQIYVMNFLNLPDVGEFYMEGKGKLYLEEEDIYIECESLMTHDKADLSYEASLTPNQGDTTYVYPSYSGNIRLFENREEI